MKGFENKGPVQMVDDSFILLHIANYNKFKQYPKGPLTEVCIYEHLL